MYYIQYTVNVPKLLVIYMYVKVCRSENGFLTDHYFELLPQSNNLVDLPYCPGADDGGCCGYSPGADDGGCCGYTLLPDMTYNAVIMRPQQI